MKFCILVLVSILASGAYAQVVNPCLVCRDGATTGDDFAPYAAEGLNTTCADFIEEIKVLDAESEACCHGCFEEIKYFCCPTTPPENPCAICPDGVTAADDFIPLADFGVNETCKALIDPAVMYEAGSEMCASTQDQIETFCCPTAAENPCIICSDGATAGDDFAPFTYEEDFFTCKEYIDAFKLIEKGTEACDYDSQYVAGYCCPKTLDNPCIMCPNGATSGEDFAPYTESGLLKTCKNYIDEYKFIQDGSSDCPWRKWEEALCCPTAPKNPCNICPDGLTAADDFYPFGDLMTCKQNIDTFKLIETDSEVCSDWGPFYKVACCPSVTETTATTIEETSTAATNTASTVSTTTFTTVSTVDGTTSTSTTGGDFDQTTTTTTSASSTEPNVSGDMKVYGIGVLAFILGVSTLFAIDVV